MGKMKAPWTPEQVEALNKYQNTTGIHPYTCPNEQCTGKEKLALVSLPAELVATPDGWKCPYCGYTQNWAHDYSIDN